jgi:very-short-patch-repair endonuclease
VLGLSRDQIAWRVHTGALIPRFRGVYAVGHAALSFRAHCIAALLAVGDDAALSHETAAYLWQLIRTQPLVIDVTTPGRRPRSRPGLRVHCGPVDTTRRDGLLLTTAQQTLHDLRRHPHVEAMTSEALFLALIDRTAAPASAPTRSELERRMLRLIDGARLPAPLCQHSIGPYTADFYWPEHRVIAETDGYAAHGHRRSFEHDRARDAWLLSQGYVVIRFTWRQLRDEPTVVVARLAAVLARSAAA